MAVYTYEDMTPSPIENATVVKVFRDGVHRGYNVTPVDGYVIHDQNADYAVLDPETMEQTPMLGYKHGTVTCPASYDFIVNSRKLYAVPEDSVPADQIFGKSNNY